MQSTATTEKEQQGQQDQQQQQAITPALAQTPSRGPSEANDIEKADATVQPEPSSGSAGVAKVETFNRVLYESGRSGKVLLWLLGISIFLTMFVYACDQGECRRIEWSQC